MHLFPLPNIPEVTEGDDVGRLILDAAAANPIQPGDILVVSQKIVSKAEGASIDLATVTPSSFAHSIAETTAKNPRLVEVILQQSRRIVKMDRGVLITETHHGFICANSAVDQSNVDGDDIVTLLPRDPDASARKIRDTVQSAVGSPIAVIISDSFNRPWREGSVNVAIGIAGMRPLQDDRGQSDDFGRTLHATLVNIADELASAAQLVLGETGRAPVAVVKDWPFEAGEGSASELLRDPARDLFR